MARLGREIERYFVKLVAFILALGLLSLLAAGAYYVIEVM